MIWLEDQKIRFYKVEDREDLRNATSPEWPITLKKYLEALKLPSVIDSNKLHEIIDWLVAFAIRLEYSDNGENLSFLITIEYCISKYCYIMINTT